MQAGCIQFDGYECEVEYKVIHKVCEEYQFILCMNTIQNQSLSLGKNVHFQARKAMIRVLAVAVAVLGTTKVATTMEMVKTCSLVDYISGSLIRFFWNLIFVLFCIGKQGLVLLSFF